MPTAPYAVEITVTVPVPTMDGRPEYRTCPQLEELSSVDYIDGWTDLRTLIKAHGGAAAEVIRMNARVPYRSFRLSARGVLSRRLLGVSEWSRSAATGRYLPAMLWTAEGLFPLNPWGSGPVVPLTGLSHVEPRKRNPHPL
jgi:hypothetical protein